MKTTKADQHIIKTFGDRSVSIDETSITFAARNLILYLQLKKAGWITKWTGEGKICMAKS